jgi:hypothetical protein
MSEVKVMLWKGGDAPNKQATLTVSPQYIGFSAYWEPGYCGCEDCHPVVGWGKTEEEAIADYWENWSSKYGEEGAR